MCDLNAHAAIHSARLDIPITIEFSMAPPKRLIGNSKKRPIVFTLDLDHPPHTVARDPAIDMRKLACLVFVDSQCWHGVQIDFERDIWA